MVAHADCRGPRSFGIFDCFHSKFGSITLCLHTLLAPSSGKFFKAHMRFLKDRYHYKKVQKRLAVACLDGVGNVLASLFRRIPSRRQTRPIHRILVIRLDQMGDVVMTKPALTALREKFPDAAIDLLIAEENRALFEQDPEIDEVIGLQSHWFSTHPSVSAQIQSFFRILGQARRKQYDLAIDFRGDLRHILWMWLAGIPRRLGYGRTGGDFLLSEKTTYSANEHQVNLNLNLLEGFGITRQSKIKPFIYSKEQKIDFENRLSDVLGPALGPRIVVHPSAGYPTKRWGSLKYWELIQRILAADIGQIVLIGTEGEKQDFPELEAANGKLVDLRGKTSLTDLLVLFESCDYFVGNDSGPSHLAAAQGMEVLVIFSGTNDSRLWRPWTNRLRLIDYPVPCSPCEARDCPLQHHECMEKITVDQVFEAVQEMLRQSKGALKKSV